MEKKEKSHFHWKTFLAIVAIIFSVFWISYSFNSERIENLKLRCSLGYATLDECKELGGQPPAPIYRTSDVFIGHWECVYKNVTEEIITDCAENNSLHFEAVFTRLSSVTLTPWGSVLIHFDLPEGFTSITNEDFNRLNQNYYLYSIGFVRLNTPNYLGDVCSKIILKLSNKTWVGNGDGASDVLFCDGEFLLDVVPYRAEYKTQFYNWKQLITPPIPPEFMGLNVSCSGSDCMVSNKNKFWDVTADFSTLVFLNSECPRWNYINVTTPKCVEKVWVQTPEDRLKAGIR